MHGESSSGFDQPAVAIFLNKLSNALVQVALDAHGPVAACREKMESGGPMYKVNTHSPAIVRSATYKIIVQRSCQPSIEYTKPRLTPKH